MATWRSSTCSRARAPSHRTTTCAVRKGSPVSPLNHHSSARSADQDRPIPLRTDPSNRPSRRGPVIPGLATNRRRMSFGSSTRFATVAIHDVVPGRKGCGRRQTGTKPRSVPFNDSAETILVRRIIRDSRTVGGGLFGQQTIRQVCRIGLLHNRFPGFDGLPRRVTHRHCPGDLQNHLTGF